jgi:hypothetical protein
MKSTMKKHFVLLLAMVLALGAFSNRAVAQTATGTGNVNWQAGNWGLPNSAFPGDSANNRPAFINPNAAAGITMQNSAVNFPIGTLTLGVNGVSIGGSAIVLQGTGTLTVNGDLIVNNPTTIGTGITLVVNGRLLGTQTLTPIAGATIRFTNTMLNSITPGVAYIPNNTPLGSRIEFGVGANGGLFPSSMFVGGAASSGLALQINGNMRVEQSFSLLGSRTSLDLRADLTIVSPQLLALGSTGPGTITGTGRLQAQQGAVLAVTTSAFNNTNAPSQIPVANLGNPFTGSFRIASTGTPNTALLGNVGDVFTMGQGAILDFASSGALQPNSGLTLRLNSTSPGAITGTGGGFILIPQGSTVETGVGFNNGILPVQYLNAPAAANRIRGTLRNLGPMTIPAASSNMFAAAPPASGVWDLRGDVIALGPSNHTLAMNADNSFTGTGRLNGSDVTTSIFLANGFNNGVLPGANFGKSTGDRAFDGLFIQQTANSQLFLEGNLTIAGVYSFGGATQRLIIRPGTELLLTRQSATATLGPNTSFIQGENPNSRLTLGPGFNGGNWPLNAVAFIPTPAAAGAPNFIGTLTVQAAMATSRTTVFDQASRVVLNGNLTVQNAITMNNSGANSLTGVGRLQGNGAATTILLGPGFNNGVIPGANFADPLVASLIVGNGAGVFTLQDTLRIGAGAAGGSLRFNGVSDRIILAGTPRPGVLQLNPGGSLSVAAGASNNLQGTDVNSALIFANGQSPVSLNPVTSPFNGTLGFVGGAYSLGIGTAVADRFEIGSVGGFLNDGIVSVPTGRQLLFNNVGTNSFRGIGTLVGQSGTASITFGSGFNGGIIPGPRIQSPAVGFYTMPASPITLNGDLTFGPASTLVLRDGARLTIGRSTVMTLGNTAAGNSAGISQGPGTPFTGQIQGTDTTSILALNPGISLRAHNLVSPFVGNLSTQGAATLQYDTPGANQTLTMAPSSLLTIGPGTMLVRGNGQPFRYVMNMTAPNSFSAAASGAINGDANTTTVTLGPNFNNNVLQGRAFNSGGTGGAPGFTGVLELAGPAGPAMRVTSAMSMTANAQVHLLGGQNLQVDPGATLTLGAIVNAVMPNPPTGRLAATDNNSVIRMPAGSGLGGVANQIDGRFFVDPFNGQLVTPTVAATFINGMTFGAVNGVNGVLNIPGPTVTMAANATMTFNSTSLHSTVMPGTGRLQGTDNSSVITLGPNAFGGQLLGNKFGTSAAAPHLLATFRTSAGNLNLLLPMSIGNGGATDAALQLGGSLNVASGQDLFFGTTGAGALTVRSGNVCAPTADAGNNIGVGSLQGTDNTASIILGANANGNIIPGGLFAATNQRPTGGTTFTHNAFLGTLQTSGAMSLNCRIALGQEGGSDGRLQLGGVLTIPGTTTGVKNHLVINNISAPTFTLGNGVANLTVAEGREFLQPLVAGATLVNGGAGWYDVYNGQVTFGPNAMASVIPVNYFTGTTVQGTLITSTATYRLEPFPYAAGQTLTLSRSTAAPHVYNNGPAAQGDIVGGMLVLGGTSTTHTVTVGLSTTLQINTPYVHAVTGATVVGDVAANGGVTNLRVHNSFPGLLTRPGYENRSITPFGTVFDKTAGQLQGADITSTISFDATAKVRADRDGTGTLLYGYTFADRFVGTLVLANTVNALYNALNVGQNGRIIMNTATNNATLRLTRNTFLLYNGDVNGCTFSGNNGRDPNAGFGPFTNTTQAATLGLFNTNAFGNGAVGTGAFNSSGTAIPNNSKISVGNSIAGHTVVFGPGVNGGNFPVDFFSSTAGAAQNQFNGTIISSTGTLNVPAIGGAAATFQVNQGLELGGNIRIQRNPFAWTFNGTGGNLYRVTNLGGTASIDGDGVAAVTFNWARNANARVFPVRIFGANDGITNTLAANVRLNVNGGAITAFGACPTFPIVSVTHQPVVVNSQNAAIPSSGAVGGATFDTRNATLNLTNGVEFSLPRNFLLRVSNLNGNTVASGRFITGGGLNLGAVSAVDTTSVLQINGGETIGVNSPRIGRGAYNGKLVVTAVTTIDAVNVTIGTVGQPVTGALELAGRLDLSATGVLNLNNTAPNSIYQSDLGNVITGLGTGSVINLGAGFNGGGVRGSHFNDSRAAIFANPTFTTLNARLTVASPLTLLSAMTLGGNPGSQFDFGSATAGDRRFTLGNNNLTLNGLLPVNTGINTYFITNGTGLLTLANVGSNITFPVGTAAAYAGVTVSNGATPSSFSVRTVPVSPATPQAAFVSTSWELTQPAASRVNGASISVAPQWASSLEVGGLNRNMAIAAFVRGTAYVGGAAGIASAVPGLTNVFTRTTVFTTNTAAGGDVLNATRFAVYSNPVPGPIASFSPTSGPSGTTITINGSNFNNVTSVTIGGVPATIISQTATQIVVRAGAGSTGAIVVTQAGGTSTSAGSFTFTTAPFSTLITSIDPPTVFAGLGEQVVTLRGRFAPTPAPTVSVLGNAVTVPARVLSNSATAVTIAIPASPLAIPGSVVLTYTQVGALTSTATIQAIRSSGPAIAAFSPNTTTASFNTFVLGIIGKGFSFSSNVSIDSVGIPRANILRFAGNPAATTNDTLFVLVPAQFNTVAGERVVRLTNGDGQSGSRNYTVTAAQRPFITSIAPVSAVPGTPDFTLTVNGSGFAPGLSQVFLSNQALNVLSNDGRTLRVTVPAALVAQPGLLVLQVVNPDQQNSGVRLPVTNDNEPAPLVTGINPPAIAEGAPETQVTISGNNFATGARVFFGTAEATVVSGSTTAIVVAVPAGVRAADGVYLVQVINPSLRAASISFNVLDETTPGPAISTVNPPSNTQRAGTAFNIAVVGDNFAPGIRVFIQGTRVDTLVVNRTSETMLSIAIPTTLRAGQYNLIFQNPNGTRAIYPYGILTATGGVDNNQGGGISGVDENPETSIAINEAIPVRVYPNPAVEIVTVEARFERPTSVVINVVNALGQTVMTFNEQVFGGQFTKQINLGRLAAGAYTIDVTAGNDRTVKRVVKQ